MKGLTKKSSRVFIIVNFILLIIVSALSVGYSAFGEVLSISTPVVNVRIIKDIRVTNVRVVDNVVNGNYNSTYEYVDYSVDTVDAKINLPDNDSVITLGVEITNIGNAEAGILDITGLPSNLEYTVSGYTLRDKICNSSNACKLGIVKEIYITIGYKNGVNNTNQTNYVIDLDLDFEEFVQITYIGLTGSYQNEIIKGGTLEINEPDDSDSYFVIRVGGVQTNDFTYINEILTVPNISGNLEISKVIRTYQFSLTASPSTANISYTVNGVQQTPVTGSLTNEYPQGTVISATISNDGYKSETRTYTMGYQAKSDTVSLIKLWTFKLTPTPSDSTVKITINGQQTTVTGTYTSPLLEEGTGVSWEVTRDYFTGKSGTVSAINQNINQAVSLDMHEQKTATITFSDSDRLSGSTYSKSKSASITANSKVIAASSTGTLNNGIANVENSFKVETDGGTTLLNKSDLATAASGKRDVSTSATWTIFNAPVASSITATIGKSGWIAVVTPDVTVTIAYVEK